MEWWRDLTVSRWSSGSMPQYAVFGEQWDTYLYGVLYAYRNVPHESTNEKPSFLLYGVDCRSPTEAALLPPSEVEIRDLDVASGTDATSSRTLQVLL